MGGKILKAGIFFGAAIIGIFVLPVQAYAFGHPDTTALEVRFVSPDSGTPINPKVQNAANPGFTVRFQIKDTTINDVGGDPQFVVLFTKNGDQNWIGRGGIQSFREVFIQEDWCNTKGTNSCGVRIRASDTTNHVTQEERFFTIDTTPPQITISSNRSDPTQKIDAEFRFSAFDFYGIDRIECGLDGAIEPCVSPKGYGGIFPDGFHEFKVRAVDRAGNSAEKTLRWRIDSTPPAKIENLSFADPTYFSDNLNWAAPAEYDAVAKENVPSSQYDIRYSAAPITEDNWDETTAIIFYEPDSPNSPKPPGESESMQIGPENDDEILILRIGQNNYRVNFTSLKLGDLSNILSANTKHYFAIKSIDADWNWSRLSNIPTPRTKRDPCDYDGDRLYSPKFACGPRVCGAATQSCDLYDNPFEWALPDEPNNYDWSQASESWPYTKLDNFWIKRFGATARDLDQDGEDVAEARVGINLISQKDVEDYSSKGGKDWYDNPFTADLFSLAVKPTLKQLFHTINDLDLDTFVSRAWREKFGSTEPSEPTGEAELRILSDKNISGLIYPGAAENTCFNCTAYNPDPATGRIPSGKTKATTNKNRAVGQIEAYYADLNVGAYETIKETATAGGALDKERKIIAASANCRDALNNDLRSGTDSSEDPFDPNREINCPTKFDITGPTTSGVENPKPSINAAAIFPDVGLVQCGRHADDYRTPIDESADCNICHLFYLIFTIKNLIISRLMPIIVALSIVAGGFLMIIARGAPERFNQGKRVIMWSVSAYGAVLLAWLLISIFFVLLGVTKWTGLIPERGEVASTSFTETTITDASKNWKENEWAGYFVEIKTPQKEFAVIKIAQNTKDTLTLSENHPFAINAGSEYKYHILNTGWWSFVCKLGEWIIADFSASPDSGIAPFIVDFTDLSLGEIKSWEWDFGDGATSDRQSPKHAYATNGPHAVILTVRTEDVSARKTRTIHHAPTADFSVNKTHGRSPLSVQFGDKSSGEVDKWSWDFDNDNQKDSGIQNPSFTYTKPGPYRVKLTVSGPGGQDTESKLNYIFVYPKPLDPLADFATSTIPGTLTATTTNLSLNAIKNASIAFTASSQSYNYCSSEQTSPISDTKNGGANGFNRFLSAAMTILGLEQGAPAPIREGDGGCDANMFPPEDLVTSWEWDFGDGRGASAVENPKYFYDTNIEPYTLTLKAVGPAGGEHSISTNVSFPPQANFMAEITANGDGGTGGPGITSGPVPLTVQFTNTATGTVDGWEWNFGDGQTITRKAPQSPNVNYIYNRNGRYRVTLKATGPEGVDEKFINNYIVITPRAEFAFDSVQLVVDTSPQTRIQTSPNTDCTAPAGCTVGESGATVRFSNNSLCPSGGCTSYWEFGDGASLETGMGPVSHKYTSNEDYTVRLTVTGPGGSHKRERERYIHIAPYANLTTNLATRPGSFNTPTTFDIYSGDTTVQFSNLTNPAIVHAQEWLWGFGDGRTSASKNTTRRYGRDGRYTVSLKAAGPGGTFTETKSEYVIFPPIAEFTKTSSRYPGGRGIGAYAEGEIITFEPVFSPLSKTGEISSWSWNFGDGRVATGGTRQNMSRSYDNPSFDFTDYTVTAIANGPGGAHPDGEHITEQIVRVYKDPVANFSAPTNPGEGGVNLDMNGSRGVYTCSWNFGGGTGESTQGCGTKTPNYTSGTYTVTLTVYNAVGVSDTHTKTFTVYVYGCTDDCSPSYNPRAEIDDGSCEPDDPCGGICTAACPPPPPPPPEPEPEPAEPAKPSGWQEAFGDLIEDIGKLFEDLDVFEAYERAEDKLEQFESQWGL